LPKDPAVEVVGLAKRFNSFTAVSDLSFKVNEGEVFGLLGPNGAGKTTTIRMLACLIPPSNGSATVAGFDIAKDAFKVRESVGVLTENPSLYERLTAYENMEFFAQAYGVTEQSKRDTRIRELLEFFDLWSRRSDRVATFSKGMKQKLAIARALIHNPRIIFLDEPTAGLDPESAKNIRDLVERLSRQEKHTVLLCTHRLEDAERLCNQMIIINRGRDVAVGTMDDLRSRVEKEHVIEVELRETNKDIVESVKRLNHILTVDTDGSSGMMRVSVDDHEVVTPEVVKSIVNAGGQILSVNVLRPSLEEAYLKLVKQQEEDGEQ
jgi:ABC-2 type transport system ATP-binding protein